MQKYSYGTTVRFGILIQQIGGVIGLFVSTGIGILLFWGMGKVEVPSTPSLLHNPQLTLACIGIWTVIVGWIISLTLINSYPTIWLGETGMTISAFLFFKIYIPWPDVIDITIGGVRFGHDLVRARRITIFHRIFGWLYSHTFYPSFIIRKDIMDRENLIREIRQRIQRSVWQKDT